MQSLDQLNTKVDVLLKKYVSLYTECTRQREVISVQEKTIEALEQQLAALEANVTGAGIGREVTDESEKTAMRKQLDLVIADIDKILKNLDE